jgi:hypothetical protein
MRWKVKLRVRCVNELKNVGAGEGDFGLYIAGQFKRTKDVRPIEGQFPERGTIECKGWSDDSFVRTRSTQVAKYWRRYGIVIVADYRDFGLIERNGNGGSVRLESYSVVQSESSWQCWDIYKRLHRSRPGDLAWFLAPYSRDACRVEQRKGLPALEGWRTLSKRLFDCLTYISFNKIDRQIKNLFGIIL